MVSTMACAVIVTMVKVGVGLDGVLMLMRWYYRQIDGV